MNSTVSHTNKCHLYQTAYGLVGNIEILDSKKINITKEDQNTLLAIEDVLRNPKFPNM